jgi:hypothetical protein
MIIRIFEVLKNKREEAQSFVELALILPIVLLILLGLVEVSFFISRYLDVMDLTREAARFASIRDPNILWPNPTCANSTQFNFFYHTACTFSPPVGSSSCRPKASDPSSFPFCNGLNPLVVLDPSIDDVLIEVITVTGSQTVDHIYPEPNHYWAFSDNDEIDLTNNGNWKKDCDGNVVLSAPHFTASTVAAELISGSPMNKGFVGVEFFYCYHQVLNLPIANWVVPNPLRIHAYSIMPLPAAQPTPTP